MLIGKNSPYVQLFFICWITRHFSFSYSSGLYCLLSRQYCFLRREIQPNEFSVPKQSIRYSTLILFSPLMMNLQFDEKSALIDAYANSPACTPNTSMESFCPLPPRTAYFSFSPSW